MANTVKKIKSPTAMRLQSLMTPEKGFGADAEQYYRLKGAAGFDFTNATFFMEKGGRANFDTYFNLFNAQKWQKFCDLSSLSLKVKGEGDVILEIYRVTDASNPKIYHSQSIDLSNKGQASIDLAEALVPANAGLFYVEFLAMGSAKIFDIEWVTEQEPRRLPNLALSITTFKREHVVEKTVSKIEEFLDASFIGPHCSLIVVDNGNSADISPSKITSPIKNKNLGGSGGFARGLLEAKNKGASHCLFMDDDAAVHILAIERTWAFLAYAKAENTAISGALASSINSWELWENGASFDGLCRSRYRGLDLRNRHQVFDMELHSDKNIPDNFYGGWWYFAFPIAAADRMPFPFFVRGDDVSFSIVNDFTHITLPGVISFQDEDFNDKETALTVYLDLRSHLVHILTLDKLATTRTKVAKVTALFIYRCLVRHHYASAEAALLAFEDVCSNPEFFAKNADLTERRKEISELEGDSKWLPNVDGLIHQPTFRVIPFTLLTRAIFAATLNGITIPFFKFFGSSITLESHDRLNSSIVFGASKITYFNGDQTKYYTVEHSKTRAMGILFKFLKALLKFNMNFKTIHERWKAGYPNYTTEEFWQTKMGIDKTTPKAIKKGAAMGDVSSKVSS